MATPRVRTGLVFALRSFVALVVVMLLASVAGRSIRADDDDEKGGQKEKGRHGRYEKESKREGTHAVRGTEEKEEDEDEDDDKPAAKASGKHGGGEHGKTEVKTGKGRGDEDEDEEDEDEDEDDDEGGADVKAKPAVEPSKSASNVKPSVPTPTAPSTSVAAADGKAVSFQNDVLPILKTSCVSCHNDKKAKGRLDLSSYAGLAKGGKKHAEFTAGDPDASRIVRMISGDKPQMPEKKPPLKADQVATIARWIQEGAKDDSPR